MHVLTTAKNGLRNSTADIKYLGDDSSDGRSVSFLGYECIIRFPLCSTVNVLHAQRPLQKLRFLLQVFMAFATLDCDFTHSLGFFPRSLRENGRQSFPGSINISSTLRRHSLVCYLEPFTLNMHSSGAGPQQGPCCAQNRSRPAHLTFFPIITVTLFVCRALALSTTDRADACQRRRCWR
jgi:hypothetical protein